jgi:regulator of replication initiation timing
LIFDLTFQLNLSILSQNIFQFKSVCQELESCKRHLADAQQDIAFIRSENVELRKQISSPTTVAAASVVSVSLAPSEVDKQLAAIRVELAGERTSRMQAERALALLQGTRGVNPVQSESAPQQQTVNASSKDSTDVSVEELYSRLQQAEASLMSLFQENKSLQQQQQSANESSAKRIEQLQSLLAGRNQDCVAAQVSLSSVSFFVLRSLI